MNPGRSERATPSLLVLAVGNLLLGDDAAGLQLLARLEREAPAGGWPAGVEFVDGGTQGLALLGRMSGRRDLLLLDAIQLGAVPGTVHVMSGEEALAIRFGRPDTAHEGGAGQLLALARLTGDLPSRVSVVGIEPARVETAMGLSPAVESALPLAVGRARAEIDRFLAAPSTAASFDSPRPRSEGACTS